MGAAAPSELAMFPGRRKMPPPMVMLTMAAASASVPMPRTSDSSEVAAFCIGMLRLQRGEIEVVLIGRQIFADDDIAVAGEVIEDPLPHFRVRLDADELRLEPPDIEPAQRFRLRQ